MNRIKDLRNDLDMKQDELAKIIKVTRATLSDYEVEKTEPKKDVWIKLSDIFGVSVDYLMGKTNNPQNDNFTNGLQEDEIQKIKEYKEMLIAYRNVKKKEGAK